MKIKLLLLLSSILIINCSKIECNNYDYGEINEQTSYDITINYKKPSNRNKSDSFNNLASKDSLYVFFEVGFENDVASIYINGCQVIVDTLSTEDQSGYAEYYSFGRIQDIKNLGIRINQGRIAFMEIKYKNLVNVNLQDGRLILSVLDNVPLYD